MLTTDIKNKVQSLWDRLWAGGLSNPITAIEQISYLLFMKQLEYFHPNVSKKYRWSIYHSLKGEILITHVKDVFKYIKSGLSIKGEPFAQSMEDASFRINSPSLLEDTILIIDDIYKEIEKQEKSDNQYFHDIQGDIYEHLLRQTSEAGKNGQFRTPRHLIQMIAEMLEPDLDGKICDLASGSAGFLVGAYQHIITKNSIDLKKDENGLPKGIDGSKLTAKQLKQLRESTFWGFDIDQTMVRIGIMNLMMHGINKPKIAHLDTLSFEYEKFEGKNSAEKYKYILANPPFTGKINSTTVSEYLNRVYPLKKDKNVKREKLTIQSEILFLERIVYMLEKDGKAAVIVPEGLLFNSGHAYKEIRRILLTDCILEGVISLPEGVFMPYTGVKTSILIFKKRNLKDRNPIEMNVWFYVMKSDGYSLDANRRKLKEKPLPIVISEWKARKQKSQADRKLQHFSVPFTEIEANGFELNYNLYQDLIYEQQNYRNPKEILLQIADSENEILIGIEELKSYEV